MIKPILGTVLFFSIFIGAGVLVGYVDRNDELKGKVVDPMESRNARLLCKAMEREAYASTTGG